MIRRKHHHRIISQPHAIQRIHHPPHICIQLRHHRVIRAQIFIQIIAIALINRIILLGLGTRRTMRSRIGINLHAIWASRNGHAPIHLVVFVSRLLGIMRILVGHKQRERCVFRHLLHALNRNITRHIRSVMIVPMLIARFIVKFHTMQKIVVTLIPDKLRKIRPQLGWYPHITRCAQMPLAHPTGSIPRIIQRACQCARPLGNIPPIAQRICLRPVLPRN